LYQARVAQGSAADIQPVRPQMARGNMSGKRYALDRVTAGRLQQKIEVRLPLSEHFTLRAETDVPPNRRTSTGRPAT
jgi:hypothetical protein